MKIVPLPLKGFESQYSITEDGNILSHRRGKYLSRHKRQNHNTYYVYSDVQLNNIKKSVSIHRMLALAFIPNPENKPQVNHIDGDGLNNSLDNLEWATNSENQLHAFAEGLQSVKYGKDHHKSRPVYLYSQQNELQRTFDSLYHCRIELNLSNGTTGRRVKDNKPLPNGNYITYVQCP